MGTATGRDRREVYVKASGLAKNENDVALTEAQQRVLMAEKGREKLIDIEESLTITVNPYGNLVYRQDYDLGDICTVVDRRLGLSQNLRITQAKEVKDKKGYSVDLTFGYVAPISKIVRWMANG